MKPNTFLLILALIILLTGMFLGGFIERKFIAEPCMELIKRDTVRVLVYDSIMVKDVVKSQPKKVAKYKLNWKPKNESRVGITPVYDIP